MGRTDNGLQWGRRGEPAETKDGKSFARYRLARFNGAAGVNLRKPFGLDGARVRSDASMGPQG